MKHWALGVALLAGGLTMTSCLGGDSDPNNYASYLTKVNYGYMGMSYIFTTPGNEKTITPTQSSINALEGNGGSLSKFVGQIGLTGIYWNPDEGVATVTETSFDQVNMQYFYSLDAPVRTATRGANNDSVATHPIISVTPQVGGYTYKPYFFDNNRQDIVLVMDYYVPDSYSGATSVSTTLMYYPDEQATKDALAQGILRLYLNYRVHFRENASENFNSGQHAIQQSQPWAYQKAFRLTSLPVSTSAYQYVDIVTQENELNTDLDSDQTKTVTTRVLTYEEYKAEFGQN